MEERRLFEKKEWPVFLVIVLVVIGVLALANGRSKGVTAVVEQNGKIVLIKNLSQLAGPETVDITGENGVTVTVEFSPDGARVTQADCPDKTCQRTGQLTRAGESSVCLPGRVVLRLEGSGGTTDIDAQTY